MNDFRFAHAGSYRGAMWYRVDGAAARPLEVELRICAEPFAAAGYNGTAEQYAREVEGAVGLLRATGCPGKPLPPGLARAFTAWRQAEHVVFLGRIGAGPTRFRPDRYWPLIHPVVHGAHWNTEQGWVIDERGQAAPLEMAAGD